MKVVLRGKKEIIYLFNKPLLKAILSVEAVVCASSSRGLGRNLSRDLCSLICTRSPCPQLQRHSLCIEFARCICALWFFFARWVHAFVTSNWYLELFSRKNVVTVVLTALLLSRVVYNECSKRSFSQKNVLTDFEIKAISKPSSIL